MRTKVSIPCCHLMAVGLGKAHVTTAGPCLLLAMLNLLNPMWRTLQEAPFPWGLETTTIIAQQPSTLLCLGEPKQLASIE